MEHELHLRLGVGVTSYDSNGQDNDGGASFKFGIQTLETPSDNESDASSDYGPNETVIPDYSDDEKVDPQELVDPGVFRYNKRVAVAALPCILLLLALGGEMLLIITTLGTACILLLDHGGEKRKCVIIFAMMFIPCHIYMLVTVIPLMWLSLWNFFLILAINGGLLFTAAWILLQFVSFRMEEPVFCQVVEQMLFTAYPAFSVFLTCWVLTTVVPLSVIPLIALLLGFMMLQVFLSPVVSSFKLKPDVDEDMNVIQQPIVVVMILILLLCPSVVHVLFALLAPSTHSLITSKSLTELIFLISLSLFLVTLLSIRQIMEYLGIPFSLVIKVRYTGGTAASLLCYPVLQAFGLVSHFLAWLPVAIVGFSILGIVLSMKKYKGIAMGLMTALTVLLVYWISTLPWQLQYNFLGYIPIDVFYLLMLVNYVLCLLCMYVAVYGSKELLGLLVSVESLVLMVCEVCLQRSELTSLPVIRATGIAAVYMLHRLYTADKLSQWSALFGASIHVTKVFTGVLNQVVPHQEEITLISCILLYSLVYMMLKMFIFDQRIDITQTQTLSGLCLLLLSLAVNGKPVLTTIGYLLWQQQPPPVLLIGLWLLVGGLLVLVFTQFHPQPGIDTDIKKVGIVMLFTSMVVFFVQPDLEMSLYGLFQWCELLTILILAAILFSHLMPGMKYSIMIASVLSVCPGIRLSLFFYGSHISILPCVLYITIVTIIITLLICYIKIDSFTESIEDNIKYLCLVKMSSLFILLFVDFYTLHKTTSFFSLPTWKAMLTSSLFCSIILKLLSYKKVPGNLPVICKHEGKSVPVLPIIGNITCFSTFILLCLQGPVDGFLHDMWCCGASLIFFCLQRDAYLFQNLREFNQGTPTSIAAITVLVIATIWRGWMYESTAVARDLLRSLEIVTLPFTLPVYVVLWVIMWRHEILSEKAVVFCLPLNLLLFLAASSYTAWILSITGISIGIYMMCFKLPMIPYSDQDQFIK
ncbi:hypothetical protein SNE40_005486 [Patella caerulea]|uniref:Uncharacterized protein n=1 Tax=Patella caerulea TaxID=87958 RepID=A0AAN8K344_PATCE